MKITLDNEIIVEAITLYLNQKDFSVKSVTLEGSYSSVRADVELNVPKMRNPKPQKLDRGPATLFDAEKVKELSEAVRYGGDPETMADKVMELIEPGEDFDSETNNPYDPIEPQIPHPAPDNYGNEKSSPDPNWLHASTCGIRVGLGCNCDYANKE